MDNKCPKCDKQDGLTMMIDLTAVMPADMFHNITKVGLRRKEVELWGAEWGRAFISCRNCQAIIHDPSQEIHYAEFVEEESRARRELVEAQGRIKALEGENKRLGQALAIISWKDSNMNLEQVRAYAHKKIMGEGIDTSVLTSIAQIAVEMKEALAQEDK